MAKIPYVPIKYHPKPLSWADKESLHKDAEYLREVVKKKPKKAKNAQS
jgi:hypothetical protein